MKNLLAKIKNVVAAIRANIKYVIALLVFVAIAVGIYKGYGVWLERQKAPYAFAQLQKALAENNTEALAKSVNFRHIFDQLGAATAEAFPFFMAGEHQLKDISYLYQTTMLQMLKTKPEDPPKKGTPEEELFKPVIALPADFMAQFMGNLAMRISDATSVLITSSIHHEQLERDFPIILNMTREHGHWVVSDLLNAADLVRAFNDQLKARYDAQTKQLNSKNVATLKKMNEILPIESCTATAGLLADGKTVLIAVHALARNKYNIAVNNMNLHAWLEDTSGKPLMDRYLNAVQPTQPGDDFTRQWIIELNGEGEEAKRVLQAGELVCRPEWRTLGLNTSQVLHTDDIAAPNAPCDKPGHKHPMALCREAMFAKKTQGK